MCEYIKWKGTEVHRYHQSPQFVWITRRIWLHHCCKVSRP